MNMVEFVIGMLFGTLLGTGGMLVRTVLKEEKKEEALTVYPQETDETQERRVQEMRTQKQWENLMEYSGKAQE